MAFLASLEHDLRPFFLQLRFSVSRKMTFPQCDSPSGKCPNYRIFLKLRRRSRPDGRRRWWRRSRPNECGRRVDQAATISLRGPKEDLHSERASAFPLVKGVWGFKNTILQRASQNRFLNETRAARSPCKSFLDPGGILYRLGRHFCHIR